MERGKEGAYGSFCQLIGKCVGVKIDYQKNLPIFCFFCGSC